MRYTEIKSIDCPPNVDFVVKSDIKLFIMACLMYFNWKYTFAILFIVLYFLES